MRKQDLTKQICKALAAKQASDIVILNVKSISDIADYFVIASGKSQPQVKAIYENLEAEMEKLGVTASRTEGVSEGRWIAVDYFDVLVHIFNEETRKFYQLEKLWVNGNNCVKYNDDCPAGPAAAPEEAAAPKAVKSVRTKREPKKESADADVKPTKSPRKKS